MKKKILVIFGIILGVLVILFILAWPAAPLLARLGVPVFCIQGSWPHFQIVACPQQDTAAPVVTPLALADLDGKSPIPIIVDDDGSPDGVIALLYFLRNPIFEVKAVTISCGEAHPEVFARHMQQLLAGLGHGDIPVGAGRVTPLEGNNAFPDPWRESSDAFWDIKLPQATLSTEPLPAAQLIVDTLSGAAQPVRMFVSGNHNNLAEALRLDPSIAEHIRDITIMGGSLYVPGNIYSDWPVIDNRLAEWNIWTDPVAAREVFASGRPLHLTPLDATNKIVWKQSDADAWAKSASPEGKMAVELIQWMLRSWSSKGVFIWDLVAAVDATDPAFCPPVPLALDVTVAAGPEQGRTVITEGSPNATACLKPDAAQIKAFVASILSC